MADAKLDQNSRPTLTALSSANDGTIVQLWADPSTHRLLTDTAGGGSGTVTSVSVVTANGFAGSVATATTTPAITISTTASGILKGNGTAILAASDGTDYLSSTTGITVSQATPQTLGATGARLTKLWVTDITVTNAIAGSVTGNAATATALATPRAIYGNNFDGTAALAQVIASTFGGTGNGFTKFSGPTTSEKTFTLPDASSTILVSGGALGTPSSGVATNLTGTAAGLTAGSVTTNANLTGAVTSSGNATSLGSFSSANLATALTDETGTGANVFANKPTFVGTIQTVTAMGAQALDGSTANVFTRTLASSETFTQSNFSTGQCFMVEVKQGSGTTYTVTWFSGITWVTSGATAPVQTTTTNGFTTYGFRCTGSNTFLGYLVGTN